MRVPEAKEMGNESPTFLRSEALLRVRLQEIQFTALLANFTLPVTSKFEGSESPAQE